MRTLLRVAMFLVACAPLGIPSAMMRASTERPIDYTVLLIMRLDAPPDGVSYRVNVEGRIDEEDLKSVVCRIVRTEIFQRYSSWRISFYQGLDEFIPDIADPVQTKINARHFLAVYSWQVKIAERQGGGMLTIERQELGEERKSRTLIFDHVKECLQ